VKKKIICIIPARSGSKGVPGKNVKLLGGKPLLQYTVEFAKNLGIFETICLSTDSEKIRHIGIELGIETPFLRPAILALDDSSSFDVVKHVIDFYKSNLKKDFDYVCLLQPTVPFRDADNILPVLIDKMSLPHVDTIISFREVPHKYNPEWLFNFDEISNTVLPLSKSGIVLRRQDLQRFYYRDGSIYVFKVDNLKSDSIYGNHISPIILSDNMDINIDNMEDWLKAENYLSFYGRR
jgi:CMP-N,N'-diacetyllegionaminic acid synthase